MTRKVTCDEREAWEFVAIACQLCEADGAYRGQVEKTLVFITFSDLKLTA